MMDDRKPDPAWDDLVEAMKNTHNPPPAAPRDRMWASIEAARAPRRRRGPRPARPAWPGLWPVAAAAVLVLGIAIGRLTLPSGPAAPVRTAAVAEAPAEPGSGDLLYRQATADLFGRADFLLTDFKVTACTRDGRQAVPGWAGGMLAQTRLLLGSPMARNPEVRDLLLDLELVLAQIAGINPDHCNRDAAWIRDALTENATIDRLRLLRPELSAGQPL